MGASAEPAPRRGEAALDLAGERLLLRADHSLYWPAGQTLFVADTHFGKGDVFRRRGVSVPSGTTGDDLARLTRALDETAARQLVVLGDFLHAPPDGDEPWLARFAAWRGRHRKVAIAVTRGNHDRTSRLPVDLEIDWRTGPRLVGPFVAQHEPGSDARGPVLCGHIHPVVRLAAGGERARSPVFWAARDRLVLPAFCSFAGGQRIAPRAGDRVFVVGAGDVIEARLE